MADEKKQINKSFHRHILVLFCQTAALKNVMFGGQEEIRKTQLFPIVHCTGTHKSIDSNYTKHVTSKQVHQSWQPFPVSVKVLFVRDSKAYKEYYACFCKTG